ncbi:MAG: hypothetical protein IT311_11840 [Anaerolineales bacterium]|nr:hypothetical protein [Anaerolineales bacterium]MCZ2121669.1 hypothetical protein [Anaerolineales bacterium]
MTENQPKQQTGFLGAYFDRSSILWFSKTANLFAWIVLIYHLGQAVLALGIMTLQIVRGLVFLSGFTDFAQQIMWQLQPIVPGMWYFVGIQAIRHVLLILMDVEDNLRRIARN